MVVFLLPMLLSFNASDFFVLVKSFPHFLFYSPTYVLLMNLVSFCRIDDLSWGVKGLDTSDTNKKQLEYKEAKLDYLIIWLATNALVCFSLVMLCQSRYIRLYIMVVLLSVNLAFTSLKVFFAQIYRLKTCCFKYQ